MTSNLSEFLKDLAPSALRIYIQDNPDPDAMASALALAFLWKSKRQGGETVEIFCGGQVSHPQNTAMVNLLGIELRKTEPETTTPVIRALVDVATSGKGALRAFNVKPEIIIDHHRDNPDGEYLWKQIVPCGACSSILTRHIMEAELECPPLLAAALLVGLRTDTLELLSQTTNSMDYEAHSYLLARADKPILSQIMNYSFPQAFVRHKTKAFNEMKIRDGILTSSVGMVSSAHRDIIPIVADELLRIEGVETVVIHGVVKSTLQVSVRTKNDSLDVDSFCHKVFGKEFSGGKLGVGGAQVPLGFFAIQEDSPAEAKEAVQKLVSLILEEKLFR